jgi:hypothetical protein
MKNCCPSRSDSHCPTSRAMASIPPPGGKPTTIRTGRDGYACAPAIRGTAGSAASRRHLHGDVGPALYQKYCFRLFACCRGRPDAGVGLPAEAFIQIAETGFRMRAALLALMGNALSLSYRGFHTLLLASGELRACDTHPGVGAQNQIAMSRPRASHSGIGGKRFAVPR